MVTTRKDNYIHTHTNKHIREKQQANVLKFIEKLQLNSFYEGQFIGYLHPTIFYNRHSHNTQAKCLMAKQKSEKQKEFTLIARIIMKELYSR